jgi:glycerol-3-phosphate acyltransferase PlsY
MSLTSLGLTVVAYLMGSLSAAIVVCRMLGLPDPRTQGSRNPGATNVLRIGGKWPAFLTLAGDVLKGVLPVLAAHALHLPPVGLAAVMFAAFLGHLFPLYFGFAGGKGVATTLGVVLAMSPPVGLATCVTWLGMAAATRYSSLAALVAVGVTPVYTLLWTRQPALAVATALIALILTWRHRENIARLRAGTESRIGQKKAAP